MKRLAELARNHSGGKDFSKIATHAARLVDGGQADAGELSDRFSRLYQQACDEIGTSDAWMAKTTSSETTCDGPYIAIERVAGVACIQVGVVKGDKAYVFDDWIESSDDPRLTGYD